MTPHHTGLVAAWNIIIPVKDTGLAKTRLAPFSQPHRAALALAFALDAATAARRCPAVLQVVAVTSDRAAGRALAAIGVHVVPDEPDAGLNHAVAHGAAVVRHGDPRSGIAAMCGDLPALRAADLTRAFALAADLPHWFVADAEGTGTTMLAAVPGAELRPAFGPGSRVRHRDLGAVDVRTDSATGSLARLRRDVDTLDDLSDARRLGVGTYTSAAIVDISAA